MDLGYVHQALLTVLSHGRVPNHVAMIMDGNRRYARQNKLEIRDGHDLGFTNVATIIRALDRLGVSTMSFFMFGVDNFKRDPKEVMHLMQIIKSKVKSWLALADELEIRFNLCGERDKLDADVLEAIGLLDATKRYTRRQVNLLIAYSGEREIIHGVQAMVHADTEPISYFSSEAEPDAGYGRIASSISTETSGNRLTRGIPCSNTADLPRSIFNQLFTSSLFTANCPFPDIVIRTSGETRLSDFMLWQSCEQTHFCFISCFWPEFGIWNLVTCILDWRRVR